MNDEEDLDLSLYLHCLEAGTVLGITYTIILFCILLYGFYVQIFQ